VKKALVFSNILLVILVTFSTWPAYSFIPKQKELQIFHLQQTISVAKLVEKSSPNVQLISETDEFDITKTYFVVDFFVSIAKPDIVKKVFEFVRPNAP